MTINTATANGVRPGMVILDRLKRPSILTTDDRSINIFVSDLALHDVDNAVISACDYGLFFDDFPLKNILVEGITFQYPGDGIDAPVSFQNVTIRNNKFRVKLTGILAHLRFSSGMTKKTAGAGHFLVTCPCLLDCGSAITFQSWNWKPSIRHPAY